MDQYRCSVQAPVPVYLGMRCIRAAIVESTSSAVMHPPQRDFVLYSMYDARAWTFQPTYDLRTRGCESYPAGPMVKQELATTTW